jgi:hypothetical protein
MAEQAALDRIEGGDGGKEGIGGIEGGGDVRWL